MTPSRNEYENQICEICRLIHQSGWVANHEGNLTVKIDENRLLATPTAVSKRLISPKMLIVLDLDGNIVMGNYGVFSEINLHLAIYRYRSDVKAVLHAHPPYATSMAVAGQELKDSIMPEVVVSLGDKVPLVPYGSPLSPFAVSNLIPFIEKYDILLLENHGVLAYGNDLEQAYLRMEQTEHWAHIYQKALHLGAVKPLPAEDVQKLMDKRASLGLGYKGRIRKQRKPSRY